jgi:hypothetical protein
VPGKPKMGIDVATRKGECVENQKKDNSKVQTGKQVSLANSHKDTHTIRKARTFVNISN